VNEAGSYQRHRLASNQLPAPELRSLLQVRPSTGCYNPTAAFALFWQQLRDRVPAYVNQAG